MNSLQIPSKVKVIIKITITQIIINQINNLNNKVTPQGLKNWAQIIYPKDVN